MQPAMLMLLVTIPTYGPTRTAALSAQPAHPSTSRPSSSDMFPPFHSRHCPADVVPAPGIHTAKSAECFSLAPHSVMDLPPLLFRCLPPQKLLETLPDRTLEPHMGSSRPAHCHMHGGRSPQKHPGSRLRTAQPGSRPGHGRDHECSISEGGPSLSHHARRSCSMKGTFADEHFSHEGTLQASKGKPGQLLAAMALSDARPALRHWHFRF